jgi:hypothetical protein
MIRRHAWARVAAAAVFATLAAACSDGGEPGAADPLVDTELHPGDVLPGEELGDRVHAAMEKARTGRSSGSNNSTLVFDLAEPIRTYETVGSTQVALVGEVAYSLRGDDWSRMPETFDDFSPLGAVDDFQDREVTYVGVEPTGSLAGAHIFKWTVPLVDFNDSVTPVNPADDQVELTLWIDDTGLPRASEHHLPLVAVGGVPVPERPLVRTQYSDWGEQVDIPDPTEERAPTKADELYERLRGYPQLASSGKRMLVIGAKSICDGADRGASYESLFRTGIDYIGVRPDAAGAWVTSAFDLFCPQHLHLIG